MTPKVKFEVEGWECVRCGHKWVPRIMTEEEPTICPKCKSPYWNKARKIDSTGHDTIRRDRAAKDRVKADRIRRVRT
jgi:DNA-directed RNA polymerase subunit RPC12/RpoP